MCQLGWSAIVSHAKHVRVRGLRRLSAEVLALQMQLAKTAATYILHRSMQSWHEEYYIRFSLTGCNVHTCAVHTHLQGQCTNSCACARHVAVCCAFQCKNSRTSDTQQTGTEKMSGRGRERETAHTGIYKPRKFRRGRVVLGLSPPLDPQYLTASMANPAN